MWFKKYGQQLFVQSIIDLVLLSHGTYTLGGWAYFVWVRYVQGYTIHGFFRLHLSLEAPRYNLVTILY
ncbi:hypothetical protein DYBT9623_05462 [Dyadobacter sp. CECT 9623]|uniref:Uncharacterized protein n=1 Tax=Dyadobacter linearis TaxID=2823330 RepID=A0ABN7RMQ3_9BACT|nr:hypothetical protein DYBT9623_05462 [Dyadobacter sp. CECT 9623]